MDTLVCTIHCTVGYTLDNDISQLLCGSSSTMHKRVQDNSKTPPLDNRQVDSLQLTKLRTIKDESVFDNDEYWRVMHNNMVTTIRKDSVTFHIHKTTSNTIGMMGRMNTKLPTPTQFDGRSPQFNEWAGE
eukprot:468891-Amphidinium_carterae.1